MAILAMTKQPDTTNKTSKKRATQFLTVRTGRVTLLGFAAVLIAIIFEFFQLFTQGF